MVVSIFIRAFYGSFLRVNGPNLRRQRATLDEWPFLRAHSTSRCYDHIGKLPHTSRDAYAGGMRIIITLALIAPLTGCLVDTRPGPTYVQRREARSCPPAHHWDDGRCVYNGRGHGDDDDQGHRGHGHGQDHD
jgi:hypothetical protein